MKRLKIAFPTLLCLILLLPQVSQALVLKSDTAWTGAVDVTEDILVPAGVTLTVRAGAVIRVVAAENQRTEPEYLSPLVELTVRGTLRVEGREGAAVLFTQAGKSGESSWAGILIDGGEAIIDRCRIEGAETGVHLMGGKLRLRDCTLTGNRYGFVAQGEGSIIEGSGNLITKNDYGMVIEAGTHSTSGFAFCRGNNKKDTFAIARNQGEVALDPVRKENHQPLSRQYRDEALTGETVWQGKIVISGMVRVPEGSRLVILPGSVVEFEFKDTNGDGIGESGLLIQGVIVAKGSPEKPVTFRAAGGTSRRGAWDAINIMNSAGPWNLIEYCRFSGAYRALHFHFSRVAVTHSTFRNGYRGIQFQESNVLLRGNVFTDNRSAIQGRDSDIVLKENSINNNFQGVNFLRARLTARGNRIIDNMKEGARIREGATLFEENRVEGNRFGMLVMNAYHGAFLRNTFGGNSEIGLSFKEVDNMEVTGNFVSGNGINGLNLQAAGGRISGNLFSDNGERGIGARSFTGLIEKNNFSDNSRFAIEVEGASDITAPNNWWGGTEIEEAIFDGRDDPSKGKVLYAPPATAPFTFQWPVPDIGRGATWRGIVSVPATVSVPQGATLLVAPGTKVLFAPGAGLAVRGKIVAEGQPDREICFSSLDKREPGAWDEILLEHADGSRFVDTIIEYATWGIHSHFSRLDIRHSLFRNNNGGIRFRSGPLLIEDSLITGNKIGIRDYRGAAVVRGCAINGNEIGVFVREQGSGITLTGNNLFDNSSYNLRLGDFNTEDVHAPGNWWGGAEFLETIFDARQEPGIGMALVDPVLQSPLQLRVPKRVMK